MKRHFRGFWWNSVFRSPQNSRRFQRKWNILVAFRTIGTPWKVSAQRTGFYFTLENVLKSSHERIDRVWNQNIMTSGAKTTVNEQLQRCSTNGPLVKSSVIVLSEHVFIHYQRPIKNFFNHLVAFPATFLKIVIMVWIVYNKQSLAGMYWFFFVSSLSPDPVLLEVFTSNSWFPGDFADADTAAEFLPRFRNSRKWQIHWE